MNTFIIKNKLTRVRKTGTYSRYMKKFKNRIRSHAENVGQKTHQCLDFSSSEHLPPASHLSNDGNQQLTFRNDEFLSECPNDSDKVNGSAGKNKNKNNNEFCT